MALVATDLNDNVMMRLSGGPTGGDGTRRNFDYGNEMKEGKES